MRTLKKVSYNTRDSHNPDLVIEREDQGGEPTGGATLKVQTQFHGQVSVELSADQVKGLTMALGLMFPKQG